MYICETLILQMANLDKDIRIRISDEDKGFLEDISYEKGFNLSTFIRFTLKKEIKEWKSKKQKNK